MSSPNLVRSAGFSRFDCGVMGGILVCLALQLYLQFTQKINWDEFWFLSMIYEYQRGELSKPLQTFHVHLFSWLPGVGHSEINQIEIARSVMWVCEIATLCFIYSISRAFASSSGALVATLAYISSGVVLIHGTSFRTDPLATVAMMFCLFVLVRSSLSLKNLAAFAIAAAIAALVTLKIIFFAPALAGVALWRLKNSDQPKKLFVRLLFTALATLALFTALYSYQLATMPRADMVTSTDNMSAAFVTTLLSEGLFPRWDMIGLGWSLAPMQSMLLLLGLGAMLISLVHRKPEIQLQSVVVVLILATPLLSFVFYRNAYPYFFAFIFPSSMVLVGTFVDRIHTMRLAVVVLCLLMVGRAFYIVDTRKTEGQDIQQQTLQAVHQIFKNPVNYIDRCAMVSSFSKQGFFMSSWGYKDYIKKGIPEYKFILNSKITPLLIVNTPLFEKALSSDSQHPSVDLMAADVRILRENFIHHWGHIWVAGKTFALTDATQSFNILTPGIYTLEASTPVKIDGKTYHPDDVLNLNRGTHAITAKTPTQATLRWGEHLYKPKETEPSAPIFTGF